MKLGFRFSNLCGTVYKGGNVVFTPDGNSIISPVGNRVTVFDLQNHTSHTLPFENRKDIVHVALSRDARLLVTVDEDGRALFVNFARRVVLHRFNFKKKVLALQFSPCNRFLAVSHGNHVQVWRSPGLQKQFNPFVLHRTYTGHYDEVCTIDWAPDSRHFMSGSKDCTVRIYSTDPIKGFVPITLSGQRDRIVGCFFIGDGTDMLASVCHDGAVHVYKWVQQEDLDEEEKAFKQRRMNAPGDGHASDGQWVLEGRHHIQIDHCKIVSAAINRKNSLLSVGFSTGLFGLYELPSCTPVHTLSISQNSITTAAISSSGDWLAFGSAALGQLLVWEWQSETYVLKQQGHFYDINSLAYSPDGQLIVTGGDDGKVKLWNSSSGFCFVTFSEHTAPVKDLAFVGTGHAIVSCSLDGSVRAFDLVRYKNFRTLVTPKPTQFLSCAVDPSGEVVVAGALDPFDIYVWSLQTGRLLDVLHGHLGPVVSLRFNSANSELASGSWDKTVKLWDIFKGSGFKESFEHDRDILAVCWRPDGKRLAASTLKGEIVMWDARAGKQVSTIEGRHDVSGGRRASDRRSAESSAYGKCFNSIAYTADGVCILAGGNSKFICLYEASQSLLLKKWQLSHNRSLDGVLDKLHTSSLTEAGTAAGMDIGDSDKEDALRDSVPGAKKGDLSSRRVLREVRATCVRFSPNGTAFGVAATEGIMIYSLDNQAMFAPFELDIDVTPDTIRETAAAGEYVKAVLMSLHLNDEALVLEVFLQIPLTEIEGLAAAVPPAYVKRLLPFLAKQLQQSPHLEWWLRWSLALLGSHGDALQAHKQQVLPYLRAVQKALVRQSNDLRSTCDQNKYMLQFICQAQAAAAAAGKLTQAAAPVHAVVGNGHGAGCGAEVEGEEEEEWAQAGDWSD